MQALALEPLSSGLRLSACSRDSSLVTSRHPVAAMLLVIVFDRWSRLAANIFFSSAASLALSLLSAVHCLACSTSISSTPPLVLLLLESVRRRLLPRCLRCAARRARVPSSL